MNYIVFDLEFNQSFDFKTGHPVHTNPECPFEIIQIGAVKLNSSFEIVDKINFYIKPVIYLRIHPYVEKITGITQQMLNTAHPFSFVYDELIKFMSKDDMLCSWGQDDVKSLYKNIRFHSLPTSKIPDHHINAQKYATSFLNYEHGKSIGLKNAAELLDVHIDGDFHNALNDALYTAEIFKIVKPDILVAEKIKLSSININLSRKKINTHSLYKYFINSLNRELTSEEKAIIKTAYKLGRNNLYNT